MHIIDDFIKDLLLNVRKMASKSFTGTGIVFYKNLDQLNYTSLSNYELKLQENNIDQFISEISLPQSGLHDGYHFLSLKNFNLTHVAQYISPPIETNMSEFIQKIQPCGAREMSAMLTSLIPGIDSVGLISHNKIVKIYRKGELRFEDQG